MDYLQRTFLRFAFNRIDFLRGNDVSNRNWVGGGVHLMEWHKVHDLLLVYLTLERGAVVTVACGKSLF